MIKRIIKQALTAPWLWKSLARGAAKKGVIALTYHRVESRFEEFPALGVDKFRAQMQWLRKYCNILAPGEVVSAASNPDTRRPSVVVTFDDGFRCLYEHVNPILHDYGIPAVAFIPTGVIDEGGLLWTDWIIWLVLRTPKSRVSVSFLQPHTWNLDSKEQRTRFSTVCKEHMKRVPDAERRQIQLELEIELQADRLAEIPDRQMLNWEEIRNTSGLIEWGGHSHTHPIMSNVDQEMLELEVGLCRRRLTEKLGFHPKYFAYPNGTADDFDERCKRVLLQEGFEIAYTTIRGLNGPDTDWLAVRRLPTTTPQISDFALSLLWR